MGLSVCVVAPFDCLVCKGSVSVSVFMEPVGVFSLRALKSVAELESVSSELCLVSVLLLSSTLFPSLERNSESDDADSKVLLAFKLESAVGGVTVVVIAGGLEGCESA